MPFELNVEYNTDPKTKLKYPCQINLESFGNRRFKVAEGIKEVLLSFNIDKGNVKNDPSGILYFNPEEILRTKKITIHAFEADLKQALRSKFPSIFDKPYESVIQKTRPEPFVPASSAVAVASEKFTITQVGENFEKFFIKIPLNSPLRKDLTEAISNPRHDFKAEQQPFELLTPLPSGLTFKIIDKDLIDELRAELEPLKALEALIVDIMQQAEQPSSYNADTYNANDDIQLARDREAWERGRGRGPKKS